MAATILKVFYKKQKPKFIRYRKYDNFNNDLSREKLNNELLNVDLNNAELSEFTETFMSLLEKHAPKNRNIYQQIMLTLSQSLRKAVMLRSKFRNSFLKEQTEESKSLYNKQRNICVSLLRKTKRNYYAQLDKKIVTDNRKFWKAVSPLFPEKAFHKESIMLKEHGKTITDHKKIAKTFNNFFSNIVKGLNIDSD